MPRRLKHHPTARWRNSLQMGLSVLKLSPFSFSKALIFPKSTSSKLLPNPQFASFSPKTNSAPGLRQSLPGSTRNFVAMAGPGAVRKSEEEWRAVLSPEQFRIIRQKGTEWDSCFPFCCLQFRCVYSSFLLPETEKWMCFFLGFWLSFDIWMIWREILRMDLPACAAIISGWFENLEIIKDVCMALKALGAPKGRASVK